MSSESTLSQELIDAFIDELHDSVLDLKSCSLVSYRWLPRARKHLFSSFSLPCTQQLKRNKGLNEGQEEEELVDVAGVNERICSLSELLVPKHSQASSSSPPLPPISSFVRKLSLRTDHFSEALTTTKTIHSYPLDLFTNLQEISIIDSSFNNTLHPSSLSLLSSFFETHSTSLHTLVLNNLSFNSPSSLIDLFRGSSSSSSPVTFPSLRHLSLIDINFHPLQNWRTENPISPSTNSPHHHLNISSSSSTQQPLIVTVPPLVNVYHRPKLQSLELSSIIPELLDPLFLADHHPGPVFDLSELRHLKVTNSSSLYRYRRVFLEYGERIRELEMDFPALMNDSVASTLLPLTNLTHLTLHSCLYANQFHSIPSLIPSLPRHQYLTITSRFPSYARSNSNFIHPRNDNVTSTPIKNILTGILDEELMKVFELETHSGITDQGRLLDPDDDDSSSRVVSGGSYGGGTTSESSSSSAPVVITSRARARPERISFVFEFPAIHPSTTTGSESVVKIQKDEGCLPKTRRVIDIDVVCKTMFY